MRHRRRGLVVTSVFALAAAVLVVLPTAGAAAIACDETYVHVDDDTIVVSPNGTDDTINLQCALDLGASMPRAHIVLEAGDFYTSFLEVEGFHGVLEGAGRAETTVMTLPDGLDCVERAQERRFLVLIAFGGGDVEVRNFGIEVGGITSCEAPWIIVRNEDGSGFEAWDLDIAMQFAPGIAPLGSCPARGSQNVRVDHVSIEGIFPAYFQPYTVYRGFFVGLVAGGDVLNGCPDSRSTGDVVVTNSSFSRMPQPADLAWMDDSTVRFGAPGAGNHIRGAGDGMIVQDMSNTHVVVEDNTVGAAFFWGILGFTRADLAGEHPFTLEILNNRVGGVAWADGIGVIDNAREVTGQTMIDTVISGNTVDMGDTNYNAIVASGAGGGEIVDNTITGTARMGVAVNADRWLVSGNDVSGFEPDLADVWLTPDSFRNRVRCSSPADIVLDEGTRNNVRGCSPLETMAGDLLDVGPGTLLAPAADSAFASLDEFQGALIRR